MRIVIYIFSMFLLVQPLDAQKGIADSLKSVLDTTTSDGNKAEIFSKLAILTIPFDYTRGLSYAYLSLEFALRTKNQTLIAIAYSRIANIYSFLEVEEVALDYYRQALSFNQIHNRELSGRIHTFIGQTYFGLKQYDSALVHYKIAGKLNFEEKHQQWQALLDLFEGEAYLYSGLPDSAKKYFDSALEYFTKTNNSDMIQESCLMMAQLFFSGSHDTEAYEYLRLAESAGKKNPASHFYCRTEQELAKYYMSKKEVVSTRYHLQMADSSLRLHNNPDLRKEQYLLYAKLYKLRNDFKKSFFARKRYLQLKDSLYNIKLKNISDLMNIRYQTESKTGEIDLLQRDYEIQLIKNKKNEVIRKIGFVSVVLLVSAVLLMLVTIMFKRRTAKKLKEKKAELQVLNKQLKAKEEASLHEKQIRDKLFSIITHNLINPFNVLLGFTSLLSEEIQDYSRAEIKRYAGFIHDSSKKLQFLLENLLQWSRLQIGRIKYHPAYFDISNAVTRIVTSFQLMTDKKNIIIDISLPDESIVFADESLIEVALKNLIHNAVKYSYPGSQISLRAINDKNDLTISIEDHGTGISPEDTKDLFKLDSHFSRKGTAGEDGTGLGLILVKEILRMHNRELFFETYPGKGSIFTFSLPLTRDKKNKHDNT